MTREEVIRAMEHCTAEAADPGMDTCNPGKCPYVFNENCYEMLMRDALALLREQEPRVMDADDVFVTELGTVLYLERRRAGGAKRIVPAILTDADTWSYGTLSSYRYAEFVHEGKLTDHRDLRTYGVTWRCWTARPSPEQVMNTPWEEVRRET